LPLALLTAIDPGSPASSPMLRQAHTAILSNWETLGNVFPEYPVELYRAVLLDAAAAAFAADDLTIAAGWYTLRSVIHLAGGGRWSPVLGQLLDEWDAVVGPVAETAWTQRPQLPSISPPAGPAAADSNDEDSDDQDSDDQDSDDQDEEDAGESDLSAAQSRVAGLPDEYTATYVSDLKEELIDLVDDLSEEMSETAQAAVKDAVSRIDAVALRSDLLWWRSTGYSSSRRRRYRDLTAPQAVIAAALDLHRVVGPLTPVSVEHVLWDTVAAAAEGSVTLGDLGKCTWAADLLADSGNAEGTFASAVAAGGRTPLAADDAPVAAPDAAVALFRDLQARWLLAQPAPAAPAGEGDAELTWDMDDWDGESGQEAP
jgi:hypothetical protein